MSEPDVTHPLYSIFQTLDVDNDGYLSRDDVTSALATVGLGLSVEDIFAKLDPQNSGIIDFDQFVDGASLFTGGGENIEDEEDTEEDINQDHGSESMRSIFSLVDKDQDGFISFDELGHAVSHVIGRVLNRNELQQLKTVFGNDSSLAISMQTFMSVMKQFTDAGNDDIDNSSDDDMDSEEKDNVFMMQPPPFATPANRNLNRVRSRSRQMSNFSTDDLSDLVDEDSFAEVMAESRSIKKKNKDLSYKYELLKRQSMDDTNRIEEGHAKARELREKLKQETRRTNTLRDTQLEGELKIKQLQRKIKTLEEEQERTDAARQKLISELASLRAEDRQLRDKALQAEQVSSKQIDKLEKSVQNGNLKLKAAKNEVNLLAEELDENHKHLSAAKKRIVSIEETLCKREEDIESSKTENMRLELEVASLQTKLSDKGTDSSLSNLENDASFTCDSVVGGDISLGLEFEVADLGSGANDINDELKSLTQERDEVMQTLQETQEKLVEALHDAQTGVTKVKEAESRACKAENELEITIRRMKDSEIETASKLSVLREEISCQRNNIQALETEAIKREETMHIAKRTEQELEDEAASFKEKVAALQIRCNKLSETVDRQESKLTESTHQNKKLECELADRDAELSMAMEQLDAQAHEQNNDIEHLDGANKESLQLPNIDLVARHSDSESNDLDDRPKNEYETDQTQTSSQVNVSTESTLSLSRIQSNKSMMGNLGGSYHGEIRLKHKQVNTVPIPIDGVVTLTWHVSVAADNIFFRVSQTHFDEASGQECELVLLTPRQVTTDNGIIEVEKAGLVILEFNNANSNIFKPNRVITYEVKASSGIDGLDAPYQPTSTAEIAFQQLQAGVITQDEYNAIMNGEKKFQSDRTAQKRRRKNYVVSVEDVAFQQLLEGLIDQKEYQIMIQKHREFESRGKNEKRRRVKILNDMPGFLARIYTKLAKQVSKNAKAKVKDPNDRSLASEIRTQARVQVEKMYKFVGMCYNLADNWDGDYLELKHEPRLSAAIREANDNGEDELILFSSVVQRVLPDSWHSNILGTGNRARRAIVLTSAALYELASPQSKKILVRVPLTAVGCISLSTHANSVFSLSCPDIFDFVYDTSRRSELVARLMLVYYGITWTNLRIDFMRSITLRMENGQIKHAFFDEQKGIVRISDFGESPEKASPLVFRNASSALTSPSVAATADKST